MKTPLELQVTRARCALGKLRREHRAALAREAAATASARASSEDAAAVREVLRSAVFALDAGHRKAARALLAEWGGIAQ